MHAHIYMCACYMYCIGVTIMGNSDVLRVKLL